VPNTIRAAAGKSANWKLASALVSSGFNGANANWPVALTAKKHAASSALCDGSDAAIRDPRGSLLWVRCGVMWKWCGV
jgi:hypothetical protein